MSDPYRSSSPDSYEDLFQRQCWPAPVDLSPDQKIMKIYKHVESKSTKSTTEEFLEYAIDRGDCWPWGFFIYRTAYGSDEDWKQALAKLHRHIHHRILYWVSLSSHSSRGPEQLKDEVQAAEAVWEGFQNVIIEDRKLLDGASPAQVRQLFKEWKKRNPDYIDNPRSDFCLMIDEHVIRSLLASSEPCIDPIKQIFRQPGYVIIIDPSFPDKGGLRHEPYNVGWMRLTMKGVWTIWRAKASYNDFIFEEKYPGIRRPGLIPYCDGSSRWVEDVNGQEVKDACSSGDTDDEEEDEDDDENGYTEEGGYPFHDIYEYLRQGGHI